MVKYNSKMIRTQLCDRVRWNLGVNEVFLSNEEILSPINEVMFNKYLNEYLEGVNIDIDDNISNEIIELLDTSKIYYFCYLLCTGMYARLPERMENVNTKTLLQSIDWMKLKQEMIDNCNAVLDSVLSDYDIDSEVYTSIIDLTNESSYPNTNAT